MHYEQREVSRPARFSSVRNLAALALT